MLRIRALAREARGALSQADLTPDGREILACACVAMTDRDV